MGKYSSEYTKRHIIMGISRDSRHKRRLTGGRMPIHKKKRQFESGRPAAGTKLAEKRITKIVNVIYNAVSNELVRTNTLTKNTIVYVDATPFQKYVFGRYQGIYGDDVVKNNKLNWAWETKKSNPDFKFDKKNATTEQK